MNEVSYEEKLKNEQEFYRECENVHDLPEIFHYWSNKYLAPDMARFGFTNPDDFFAHFTRERLSGVNSRNPRIISIGSGNCDLELGICQKLKQWGIDDFLIECLDINDHMLERGKEAVKNLGLSEHFMFTRGDFNKWNPATTYEVVIANQSLHHVVNLEGLFDVVRSSLEAGGLFLVSDMIGRNGHMRWPEAMEKIEPFWEELPESYQFNRLMNRLEKRLINHDCSVQGFEGIRAQDILPLLVEKFNFKFFYPFGNIIFVFIDRSFGHNYDANSEWDRNFIDRVHVEDENGMMSGELTPTSMLAVLTNDDTEPVLKNPTLTPEFCLRLPTANEV